MNHSLIVVLIVYLLNFIQPTLSQEVMCDKDNDKTCTLGKTLVMYYSKSGNTKKVAEAISANLKCEIVEITEKTTRYAIAQMTFLYLKNSNRN